MAVLFSPFGNQQFSASGTALAVGHKIYTYAAGSSTPLATYTDSTGATPQSNPIILNTLGMPTSGQIWLTSGLSYKMVWTDASDVVIKTEDNITGVTSAATVSQWAASGLAPTYVSGTSFTLAGDQTSAFHVGRRLQFTVTAGTVYGTILTSAYGALTTVTMTMDTGQALDSGLSSVNISILTATNQSIPAVDEKVNAQTGTTYTYLVSDKGKLVTHTNAAAIAGALPIASTMVAGWWADVQNRGAGVLTITPTTSTIDGAATLVLQPGQGVRLANDGTNYFTLRGCGTSIVSAARQSLTTASVTFLSIPSGVKKITIPIIGMSTDGTDVPLVQLGTSAGLKTSGYLGGASNVVGGGGSLALNQTAGFGLSGTHVAAAVMHGVITLVLENAATFTWACSFSLSRSDTATTIQGGGSVSLAAALDRFAFVVGGGNVFDAGTASALYEF